ncbi:MAG TPA: hypothetical protein VKV15_27385 [Bryobacteraceae bacterium]|nr:hypothetical protein [Bryobacteraceae bacterium]
MSAVIDPRGVPDNTPGELKANPEGKNSPGGYSDQVYGGFPFVPEKVYEYGVPACASGKNTKPHCAAGLTTLGGGITVKAAVD